MNPTPRDYGRIGGIVTREQRKQRGIGYSRGRDWTDEEQLAAWRRHEGDEPALGHGSGCTCPECGDDVAIMVMVLCDAVETRRMEVQ